MLRLLYKKRYYMQRIADWWVVARVSHKFSLDRLIFERTSLLTLFRRVNHHNNVIAYRKLPSYKATSEPEREKCGVNFQLLYKRCRKVIAFLVLLNLKYIIKYINRRIFL